MVYFTRSCRCGLCREQRRAKRDSEWHENQRMVEGERRASRPVCQFKGMCADSVSGARGPMKSVATTTATRRGNAPTVLAD